MPFIHPNFETSHTGSNQFGILFEHLTTYPDNRPIVVPPILRPYYSCPGCPLQRGLGSAALGVAKTSHGQYYENEHFMDIP